MKLKYAIFSNIKVTKIERSTFFGTPGIEARGSGTWKKPHITWGDGGFIKNKHHFDFEKSFCVNLWLEIYVVGEFYWQADCNNAIMILFSNDKRYQQIWFVNVETWSQYFEF